MFLSVLTEAWMNKVIRLLAVLVVSLCFAVSCGDSKKNDEKTDNQSNQTEEQGKNDSENQGDQTEEQGKNDSENQGKGESESDGNEKFVTVGSYNKYYYDDEENEYCPNDHYRFSSATSAAAATKNNRTMQDAGESDFYKLNDNILWIGNRHKGLIAVDISDPENTKILDHVKTGWKVVEIYFRDSFAYILVNSPNSAKTSKLIVVNTTNPENLSTINELYIDGPIAVSKQIGDIVYLETIPESDRTEIVSINIKDPLNITIADTVSLYGTDYVLYFSQKSIYAAESDGNRVTVFDMGDNDSSIVEKAKFVTAGSVSDSRNMHENGSAFFAVSSSSESESIIIIESFDISDFENIKRLDKLEFDTHQHLDALKFEGANLYAVIDYYPAYLHVFDIHDPDYIRERSSIEVPDSFDYLEVRGTKLIAAGNEIVALYDATTKDPSLISSEQIPGDGYYVDYEGRKTLEIFDELGLILYSIPYRDNFGIYTLETNKLHLIDFDLEQGLKGRGFIESDNEIKGSTAIQDFIFYIDDTRLVTVDMKNRSHPKVLSELTIAADIRQLEKCGKSLCNFSNLKLHVYDSENFDTLWESMTPESGTFGISMGMLKNSSNAYFFITEGAGIDYTDYNPDFDMIEISKESRRLIKTVKFSDDGKFEEDSSYHFRIKASLGTKVVSENNVMAIRGTKYTEKNDGSDCYNKESKIIFVEMSTMKEEDLDFDYKTIDITKDLFAGEATVWASGCKLKQRDENDEELAEYYCYAVPFDVSDPKNPKAGKRVNIPGELVGIGDDGKYLYTQTPSIVERNSNGNIISLKHDFYILKLNDNKTDAEVVKKESFDEYDSTSDSVFKEIFIKNDKVFFVKKVRDENYNTHYEVTLFSSEGEELSSESFEKVRGDFNSVQDGGLLVKTADGLKYIDETGKSQAISDDFSFDNIYFQNSQLLDGKIYIPVGWDGIYAVDVK